jgi:hypothetical protein
VLVDGSLDPICGPMLTVAEESGTRSLGAAIPDGTGGAFLAWTDARGSDPDIYALRLSCDAATATMVTGFEAERRGGAIEVRWRFAPGHDAAWTSIEHREGESGVWEAIDAEQRSELGWYVVRDGAPRAGGIHWYRLIAGSGAATRVFGPIAVTLDRDLATAPLLRVTRNPTRGPVEVEFVVREPGEVVLTVVDLQGREVTHLLEGPRPAGRFTARWVPAETHRAPESGVYFVRYRSARLLTSCRVLLIR